MKIMPSSVIVIHLVIFQKTKNVHTSVGKESLSSDTKANSYSCVKGSEHHKYQWGKEMSSVSMINYMQFLEKELDYVPIHPETQVHRLHFRKHGASFPLNYICVVLMNIMGPYEVKIHAKIGSARLSRGM